jgi:sialate O-acetylesterase
MSAVHFFFGRHLAQHLPNVPIGLITSAVSGTAIEKWSTCAGSGRLYTGQIVPLQPYAIRGATWYQGEWDARGSQDSSKYYWQLPCLIAEWSADWGQGILPFYVVQMPKMGINSIHIVRDAELQTTLSDPKVEMIVTIDQPGSDVHPPCKEPFGFRLAMLARKFEYGQALVARSPTYNAAASYVAGHTIGVVFDNVAGGLESSGGPLAEWEIAGSDGNYVAASAAIVGADTVEVWSSSVPSPVSARYAFSTNPAANNLVNSEGLPASPIREVAPGVSGPACGDGTCDPGEDQCDCEPDCGMPPLTEAVCDDGVDEDCDGGADCSDPTGECDADPACDCLGKHAICSDDTECCSNKCRGGKCR